MLTSCRYKVTAIPTSHINFMERAALQDLYGSLYIPMACWIDHVNELLVTVVRKDTFDEMDAYTTYLLDDMLTEARHARHPPTQEMWYQLPSDPKKPAMVTELLKGDETAPSPAFAAEKSGANAKLSQLETSGISAAAIRDISELDRDESEEEEFLEYDGAKPWLPPLPENRQFQSHPSRTVIEASHRTNRWRCAVSAALESAMVNTTMTTRISNKGLRAVLDWRNSSVLPGLTDLSLNTPATSTCPRCGCGRGRP